MRLQRAVKFKTWVVDTLWYTRHPLRWFLLPLAIAYRMIVALRRYYLKHVRQRQFPVPIIVVGNLTVGGVGKTPLVIALATQLQARGVRVGIVSRGYGARVGHFPHEVCVTAEADAVGDEPLLLAKKTGCPVVIAPKRADAVQYLLDKYQSQIIISDDGLQHYAMGRAIEIVVIDGRRGVGNGLCLPAGPLREGVQRLQDADFIVINGAETSADALILQDVLPNRLNTYRMDLLPGEITGLANGKPIKLKELTNPVAAIAAIGHPQRFFSLLEDLGVGFNAYSFDDHHRFRKEELQVTEKMVVMTEKDAVKCQPFATELMYFLPVEAKVDNNFWDALWRHKQLQGYIT